MVEKPYSERQIEVLKRLLSAGYEEMRDLYLIEDFANNLDYLEQQIAMREDYLNYREITRL